MNSDKDPIVAIATAPGRGGIGIVRVSGSDLGPVIGGMLGGQALTPRHATLLRLSRRPWRGDRSGHRAAFPGAAFVHR